MKSLRVLIGCEFSGIVRDAFKARGHDAWSCDLLPAQDGSPNHFECDVLNILELDWDLAVFHPPCTYLCSSGLHWNKRRPGRERETEKSLEFVAALLDAPIPQIALENPVGCISSRIRKPDQIIQPWQFGHPESKATCLWLKNLPHLKPTNILQRPAWIRCDCCEDVWCALHQAHAYDCKCPELGTGIWKEKNPYEEGGRWDNQTPSGQNKLGPSEDRWKERAITYKGIAKAMGVQWGGRV